MSEYFPEPKSWEGKVKFELDLSSYAAKADFKSATGFDTTKFDKKDDLPNLESNLDELHYDKFKNVPSSLSSLKSKVDKLDFGKLETALVDLSKLSNVVKNNVVKKTEYNAKIKIIEDKIPDFANLDMKTTLHDKINEIKGEISSITNLATNTDYTAVENKIPNVSNLVKKNWL